MLGTNWKLVPYVLIAVFLFSQMSDEFNLLSAICADRSPKEISWWLNVSTNQYERIGWISLARVQQNRVSICH